VRTILQAIDLSDRLTCRGRQGPFELVCPARDAPADRRNLVWKAAERLWDAAGRAGAPRDAHITLEKRIPARAGLGGGSSDAAAALLALRKIWKIRLPDEDLVRIASKLGADVPFFLVGGTALALGAGEEIYPLAELPRLPVVVVVPPFGVATVDAYRWLDEQKSQAAASDGPGYLSQTWLGRVVPLVNDLEQPVIARYPMIDEIKGRLRQQGAVFAAMSGSGSAVFGVFSTAARAGSAARRLRQDGLDARASRFLRRPAR
jgi:4-diphosphocytidyl-2-C-methyl-D-erythritol kinase